MRIGELIRNYRLEHGFSIGDFAKLAGISKPYVSMLEAGKTTKGGKQINPSVETVRKISRAVGIPLNDMLRMVEQELAVPLSPTPQDEDEVNLLEDYRKLNDTNKQQIRNIVAAFLVQQEAARK